MVTDPHFEEVRHLKKKAFISRYLRSILPLVDCVGTVHFPRESEENLVWAHTQLVSFLTLHTRWPLEEETDKYKKRDNMVKELLS